MGRKQKRKSYPPSRLPVEPRSRAFTGCGTCRSRHLKCDEAKPTCSICQRLNLPCQGYAPRLLWPVSEQSCSGPDCEKADTSSFRYPLFTESDRSSMTLDMVNSLGHHSATDILLDLDAESVTDDDLHAIGPFGVFRACQSLEDRPSCPPIEGPEKDVEEISLDVLQASSSPQFLASFFANAFPHQPSHCLAADTEGSETLLNLDMNMSLLWDGIPHAIVPDECSMHLLPSPSGTPGNIFMGIASTPEMSQPGAELTGLGPESPPSDADARSRTPSAPFTVPSPCISNFQGSGTTLPAHAAVLLRYLKAEVLEDPKSKPSRGMSPWKLLLFPCALETFAEISLWNSTSYARRSILSVLLAKGAFHLSNSTAQDESVASFGLRLGSITNARRKTTSSAR